MNDTQFPSPEFEAAMAKLPPPTAASLVQDGQLLSNGRVLFGEAERSFLFESIEPVNVDSLPHRQGILMADGKSVAVKLASQRGSVIDLETLGS